jgi:hypothetical protein
MFRIFLLSVVSAEAAKKYCNTKGDICEEFDNDFNVAELSEIQKWWDEMERNVRPMKCEFHVGEDVEQGGRKYANAKT